MQTLKDLAGEGKTVVASIHQPRSSIFEMFDDLLVHLFPPCNSPYTGLNFPKQVLSVVRHMYSFVEWFTRGGKTMVFVHQPRSSFFEMFDDLLVC